MKVIIISIDALRADSLGCYGYERDTSPHIDAIASDGVIFKNAYTPANWTNPSYYSLITALYPLVHGVTNHHHGISGIVNTLPETLARQGYTTSLYSDYYTLLDDHRFGRHFQDQVYFDIDRDSDKLKERITSLEARDLFFLIHIGNYVHEPYCAPEELVREFWPHAFPEGKEEIRRLTREMNLSDESMRNVLRKVNLHRTLLSRTEVEYLKACYDAGIKYVDRWVGDFFNFIKECSGEEYLFVLTADHGQGFFEHGFFGHGLSLHQELIRVPLIFYKPCGVALEIDPAVQLIDVFPTMMEITGSPVPAGIDGVSFRKYLEKKITGDRRRIISEGFPLVTCIGGDKKLIISFYRLMNWKEKLEAVKSLIRSRNLRRLLFHLYSLLKTSLYDLRSDPGERRNLSWRRDPEKKILKQHLKRWYRQCRHRTLVVTDQEIDDRKIIEQLKGLGYL